MKPHDADGLTLSAESDARYGSFDFRAAHAAAAPDLQALLDSTESLPFRRRGYERDGMLKTVIERANFQELYESSRSGANSKAGTLAAVPGAVAHFALDALFERPVQAEVVELLLLTKEDRRFASCVLIHGMGGTGKTVTAVAVVRQTTVRTHYAQIFWLTVGADAVGETGALQQLQVMLYSQLTGKTVKTEDIHKNDKQAWQQKLVEAIFGTLKKAY